MQDTPTVSSVEARVFFLRLVAEQHPDVYDGSEMLEAVQSHREYLSKYESSSESPLRYVGITVHEAGRCEELRTALDKWAARFNLNDRWCLDHLVKTLAFLPLMEGEDNPKRSAWWRATFEDILDSRSAIYGPRIEFRYTFPPTLLDDDTTPSEIVAAYQNPLTILSPTFLLDIREKFAERVIRSIYNKECYAHDDNALWTSLEQIARETLAFDRKLAVFTAEARKTVKTYVKQVRAFRELDSVGFRSVAIPQPDQQLSRNLRWLVMYQVLKMSYGDVAKATGQKDKTVTDGVKAAAKVICLTLRKPNDAGRKKGSLTKQRSTLIVR